MGFKELVSTTHLGRAISHKGLEPLFSPFLPITIEVRTGTKRVWEKTVAQKNNLISRQSGTLAGPGTSPSWENKLLSVTSLKKMTQVVWVTPQCPSNSFWQKNCWQLLSFWASRNPPSPILAGMPGMIGPPGRPFITVVLPEVFQWKFWIYKRYVAPHSAEQLTLLFWRGGEFAPLASVIWKLNFCLVCFGKYIF